jgi:hypothetical protein
MSGSTGMRVVDRNWGKAKVLACRRFDNSSDGFTEVEGSWRLWRPRTWAMAVQVLSWCLPW